MGRGPKASEEKGLGGTGGALEDEERVSASLDTHACKGTFDEGGGVAGVSTKNSMRRQGMSVPLGSLVLCRHAHVASPTEPRVVVGVGRRAKTETG
jgi:hypothetical protein